MVAPDVPMAMVPLEVDIVYPEDAVAVQVMVAPCQASKLSEAVYEVVTVLPAELVYVTDKDATPVFLTIYIVRMSLVKNELGWTMVPLD